MSETMNVVLILWSGINTFGLFFMFLWVKDHKELEHKETAIDAYIDRMKDTKNGKRFNY